MAIMNNDELNINENVYKKKDRSIPIDDYFDEMDIDEEEKEKRILLANLFFDLFVFVLSLIKSDKSVKNDIDVNYYTEMVNRRFNDAIESVGIDTETTYPYLMSYSQSISKDIVESTINHLEDAYYTSNDRARYIAENESNTVYNYVDYENAISQGNKYKTWVTMRDEKVRDTHAEIDGLKIGIYEFFAVGNSLMLYPKDFENCNDARELVNCRCSIKYSKN